MTYGPRSILNELMQAALDAADSSLRLPNHLPDPPKGRTIVIGAGKAAAKMAKTVEDHWQAPLEGLVITRYGHGLPCERIEVIEAGHPVPDEAGTLGAQKILSLVQDLTADDLVICLISGGGSALLAMPLDGISLDDKRAVNKELLKRGADIAEMNCVRKHLSALKGGRLGAAAAPAKLVTYLISDVPGDDPATIASGPTVADPTTQADALAVVKKYDIPVSDAIRATLQTPENESVKPGDARLAGSDVVMLTRPQDSLEAAAQRAIQLGLNPLILSDCIEGEARDVAKMHAGLAKQVVRFDQPVQRPCALISGGETTVTVKGTGRGGRNAEFLLSLAISLNKLGNTYALAIDTDGIDGVEDNAGAILFPDSLTRAAEAGIDPAELLSNNDAYGFFHKLEDLIVTGPTLTNVNDFRVILIL